MESKIMYKVSPSGIGSLLECPRCLWLYANEGTKRPRGIFPSLPDGMDDIFKKYFDAYRLKSALPPELKGLKVKLFADLAKLDKWRNIDYGKGGLKAEFADYNIILQGAIDELLISGEGLYIPLDFKTRGYPRKEDTHEHYQTQLDLYALLLEKEGLLVAGIGYLLFFSPRSYEPGLAKFNTELVEMKISPQNGLRILEKVHQIATGPLPQPHINCEYCAYFKERSL